MGAHAHGIGDRALPKALAAEDEHEAECGHQVRGEGERQVEQHPRVSRPSSGSPTTRAARGGRVAEDGARTRRCQPGGREQSGSRRYDAEAVLVPRGRGFPRCPHVRLKTKMTRENGPIVLAVPDPPQPLDDVVSGCAAESAPDAPATSDPGEKKGAQEHWRWPPGLAIPPRRVKPLIGGPGVRWRRGSWPSTEHSRSRDPPWARSSG